MTCFCDTRVKGLPSNSEREVLWGREDHPREEGPPLPHLGGEGQAGLTNGLMIHRRALVYANWLCRLPDS